jgi:hypothetical protein
MDDLDLATILFLLGFTIGFALLILLVKDWRQEMQMDKELTRVFEEGAARRQHGTIQANRDY